MSLSPNEIVIRIVHAVSFDADAPIGFRLSKAAMQTKEFLPTPENKGASVFLKSALRAGTKSLDEACPKWVKYGYSELRVGDLNALGITVESSPEDCEIAELRHAHYSLVGITESLRKRILQLIDRGLVRKPAPSII